MYFPRIVRLCQNFLDSAFKYEIKKLFSIYSKIYSCEDSNSCLSFKGIYRAMYEHNLCMKETCERKYEGCIFLLQQCLLVFQRKQLNMNHEQINTFFDISNKQEKQNSVLKRISNLFFVEGYNRIICCV